MKHLIRKYENIFLILALFLFASVLLSGNLKVAQVRGFMEKAVLAVVTPIQKGVTNTVRNVAYLWSHYIYLVGTSEENEELRRKLHEQTFQNGLLLEELKRYRRVENLISFHPVARSRFQVATVVAWDSTNLTQTLLIDRGANNNVREGMVVLTHQGLVGRTVLSTGNASRVLMITDARNAVDAYLQESRVRCIVVGQNKNTCVVRYLPIDAKVKVGDMLISSGLGGVYPKGLPLGRITSLKPGSDRLFYEATMTPSADFNRLEEVLVMLDKPAVKTEPEDASSK